MNCEEIKKIIPKYFQHQASDEEIKSVEEHLCICHTCRTELGELMDKKDDPANLSNDLNQCDKIKDTEPIKKSPPEIKIVSNEEIMPDIPIPAESNQEENIFAEDNSKEKNISINEDEVNSKIEYVSSFDIEQSIDDKKKSNQDKGDDTLITNTNVESVNTEEEVRISFEDEFGKYDTEESKSEETTDNKSDETITEELGGDKALDLSMSQDMDVKDLEKDNVLTQNQSKDINREMEEKQNNKKSIKKIEFFEYVSLILGIIVLIFVVYLLIRG